MDRTRRLLLIKVLPMSLEAADIYSREIADGLSEKGAKDWYSQGAI